MPAAMSATLAPLPEDDARFAGIEAPPRVRRLLGALLALARQSLTAPLTLTVVELERELLREAEQARSSQQQADLIAQARQVHPFADGFSHRFLDQLAAALAGLFEQEAVVTSSTVVSTLTLVHDADIDRDIVLAEIVRREMQRSTNALQLLGQRLAVLAACPALDNERVPLGPAVLCGIVHRLGEAGQLEPQAQLALYRSFERQVLDRLGEFLGHANALLGHEGVLPGLVYTPFLARAAGTRRGAAPPGPAPAGASAPQPRNAPVTSWNGVGSAVGGSWSSMMHEVLGGPATAVPPPVPQSGGHDAPSSPLPPPLPVDLSSPAMASLHQLLARARLGPHAGETARTDTVAVADQAIPFAQHGTAADSTSPATPASVVDAVGVPPDAAAEAVPSAAVDAVLGQLQAGMAKGALPRSMVDLQAALLSQLRAEHGEHAALTTKDGDTLDLLAMLFQQIRNQQRSLAPTDDLVARLQVPLARAALSDPGFFVRDEHPARELLNTLAEAGAAWLDESDLDPQLVQKLGRTVDTVVESYHDDPAVFAAANEEVQEHFRAAAHKAELAERRHVEAARGKERLELARQQASALIDRECAQAQPPRFVQTLLRQAWADVLTLAWLRHGEASAQWEQRLQQTARITSLTAQPTIEGACADEAFAADIEAAILQIGCHQDEARAIARRLSTPGGQDDSTSRTELTARLKARSRLGEHSEAGDTRQLAPLERSGSEETCYRQLRVLPFGTWFEFVSNQQGDLHRQRLAWYSLVTEHALFVNPRGQKVAEYTLDTLARLMAQDQARIVTQDKGRLVDRAWQATLRTLRALAGSENGGIA